LITRLGATISIISFLLRLIICSSEIVELNGARMTDLDEAFRKPVF
jgi:hypothetical protein